MNTNPPSAEESTLGSTSPRTTSFPSVLIDKFWGGGIREPTVLAPVVICVPDVARLRVCGTLHLVPFVNGILDVVRTSGGGFGDLPPTVAVVGFG